jgi:hypothetical protein
MNLMRVSAMKLILASKNMYGYNYFWIVYIEKLPNFALQFKKSKLSRHVFEF